MSEEPSTSLSRETLPRHIAVIMDGNGRWAKLRNLPRPNGHSEGLNAAKRIVKAASDFGIGYLSLYTFSTENWKRATEEVSFLMFLVRQHLRKEYDFYRENRIRVVHSGDLAGLPQDVRQEILFATESTADFSGLTVNLALNYGGRDEIIRAVNRWRDKLLPDERQNAVLQEDVLAGFLDQHDFPDPDLIIRTGGECRLSNFLLWQSAYSELYFSDKLWPDWAAEDLTAALLDFQSRDRRFGGVK